MHYNMTSEMLGYMKISVHITYDLHKKLYYNRFNIKDFIGLKRKMVTHKKNHFLMCITMQEDKKGF
jgi:hypothetical protein